MYDQREMTVAQIAEVLGVSRATVYRALDRMPSGVAQRQRWSVLSRHIDDGVPLAVLSQESGVSLRTLQR